MISTTAAERVFARLADLVEQVTPDRIRLLGAESLLGAGLSAAKARAIVALADASSDGRLPLHALDDWGDDELTEALTALPGIGPWTADMFLLFGLGRADILPVGDYGLRSGVQSHWGMSELPGKAELRALAEPWRPFRGIATWYIWRSKGAVPQS
jgi:DNA-3-methyladenine glycosylase II